MGWSCWPSRSPKAASAECEVCTQFSREPPNSVYRRLDSQSITRQVLAIGIQTDCRKPLPVHASSLPTESLRNRALFCFELLPRQDRWINWPGAFTVWGRGAPRRRNRKDLGQPKVRKRQRMLPFA